MCFNCGCGKTNDDMGNPKNITNKTFQDAADAEGQSIDEAKKKTLEQLKKELESTSDKFIKRKRT